MAITVVTKLTCKETIRLICEYLDGRLSPSVARDVREHLHSCKNCRMVLDAAQKTLMTYFGSEPESASAENHASGRARVKQQVA